MMQPKAKEYRGAAYAILMWLLVIAWRCNICHVSFDIKGGDASALLGGTLF